MMHPDEALEAIQTLSFSLATETLHLSQALGRVLARELTSPIDQPPFDKSAMDGFAVAGPPGSLGSYRIDSTLAAGAFRSDPVAPGSCVRIMTGAPLPPGTDRVQRVEWSLEAEGRVSFTKPESGDNVIRRGENLRSGELALGPRRLKAQDLGILASCGYAEVPVVRAPRVAVISTGDELRAPGEDLGAGCIYDSNGVQLVALARAAGAQAGENIRVRDDEALLEAAIAEALDGCELLVLSGGVSMGDFDYVPRILERCGVERLFHGIAMKPGKPTWFGRRGGTFVFGLPGNPVSTFVNFEVFGLPLLARMQGIRHEPIRLRLALAEPLSRRQADRVEYFPARREGELVRPIRYGGSSALQALAEADCLLRLEIGDSGREAGEEIDARLL